MKKITVLSIIKTAAAVSLLAAVTLQVQASTIWNGPTMLFTHSAATGNLQDSLTSGVSITRGTFFGLYNSKTESGATAGVSPKDTAWAVGTLANYNTLTYGPCPLEQGGRPPNDVNKTYVVHLVTEDIYLQLTLNSWASGGNDFSYTRTTPLVAPTVSITSPAAGAVFGAPASVSITASAAVSSGTVTNVQFFTNGISVGSVAASPFILTASLPAPGAYALTAAATAAGISTTSAVVNITVLPSPAVTLTNPPAGAVFAAPANIKLEATATVSSGTVTNVQFLTNGISAGSVLTSPFIITANSLATGAYSLKAVATAAGISTTSAAVNVTVVTPAAVTLSAPGRQGGQFGFNYSANTGLSYVIQSSTNLTGNWLTLATNVAAGGSVPFTNSMNATGAMFYRVGRLPNP